MDGGAIMIVKMSSNKTWQVENAAERRSPIGGMASATASIKKQISDFAMNVDTRGISAVTAALCGVA